MGEMADDAYEVMRDEQAAESAQQECSWCGCPEKYAPIESSGKVGGCWNSRGEWFCCKSHRDSSNRALKRLIA